MCGMGWIGRPLVIASQDLTGLRHAQVPGQKILTEVMKHRQFLKTRNLRL